MSKLEYYELVRIVIDDPPDGQFRVATAAVLECHLCGTTIDGMGGPGHGAICTRCAELVISGRAKGAIVWEDENK